MTLLLPRPIALAKSGSITLSALLSYEFGAASSIIGSVYLYERSASYLVANDFDYWEPNAPVVNRWTVSGSNITADVTSKSYLQTTFSDIQFVRGNSIATFENVYLGGDWFLLNVIDPSLASAAALQGRHGPTAQDIIDMANKFFQKYGTVDNSNDCHQIAREVAAAAGAVLPSSSGSLNPADNEEQGFWRIAYRGSDPGAISNWQTLVKPGDIIRMGWTRDGNPHTTTVLAVDAANQTLTVYDNGYYVGAVEKVGVHTQNFDQKTNSSEVTIYRLTIDDTFLVSGDSSADTLLGSGYNERFTPVGGNDYVDGSDGADVVVEAGKLSQYTVTRAGNQISVQDSVLGRDGVDLLFNIEKIQFSDFSINTTMKAEAAKLPAATVNSLVELYVAYFARTPEASGLSYWIDKAAAGESLTDISKEFYNAGVQYSSLTGYSANMANTDFIKVVYANVLGRTGSTAPNVDELSYWDNRIKTGLTTKEGLIQKMLSDAHAFANDPTWGWVPKLLDNKISVGYQAAVTYGLDYNSSSDAIAQGIAIAHAVTSTDTSAAVGLIGVAGHVFL